MENSKKWTEAELEYLYKERQKGTPYKIIARTLNRSVKALETKYNKDTVWSIYKFYDADAHANRAEKTAAMVNKDNISIQKSLDKYRIQADIIGDKLVAAARNIKDAPLPVYSPSKKTDRTAEHMGLMLSDLHIGHEHTMEETGGLSEYNLDIFHGRLQNLK